MIHEPSVGNALSSAEKSEKSIGCAAELVAVVTTNSILSLIKSCKWASLLFFSL